MADENKLHDPWLIAAWPGMGNVAMTAVSYLVSKLGMRVVSELAVSDIFDVTEIEVRKGIAKTARRPRNVFLTWKDPQERHDLLIFIGEAQPDHSRYALSHRVLSAAAEYGVSRVFTFAAMASQLHPAQPPKVFAAATTKSVLPELRQLEVELLSDGQIGGLNGVLLAAAAERKIPGICLLGEMPFFATQLPNPAASRAVLEVFCTLSGIEIDMSGLNRHVEAMQEQLVDVLEQLQAALQERGESIEGLTAPPPDESEEIVEAKPAKDAEPELDLGTRQHIERLFEAARQDRSKAMDLKKELDRHRVFKRYEDRFLDLFKKAG